MLKLRKKLLTALLVAALTLTCVQTTVWSEGAGDAAETASDSAAETTEKDSEEKSDEDEVVLVTEEEALAAMKLYAENDNLALYVNEDEAAFAVQNKASGYIWWSSPINADNDPIAKGAQVKTMKSMVYVETGDPVVNRTTKTTLYDSSVSKGNCDVTATDTGVKFLFKVSKLDMEIPVYIDLHEDHFTARIPTAEIVEETAQIAEEGGNALLNISLLSHLGAAGTDDNGYIFVADGSGAVINYNNGKTNTSVYDGQVYGRDLSIGTLLAPPVKETVNLPVYGLVTEGEGQTNALLAVASQGDEFATIKAGVSGQSTTSYNTCWFDFKTRATDSYFMGTNNKELKVFEAGAIKIGDIQVDYYPLQGDEISYVDLADKYREHLVNTDNIKETAKADSAPFYFTTLGGTVVKKSILGFPVDTEVAATTYSQALEIIKMLEEKGVDNMVVNYEDFNAAGIIGMISAGVDYSGTLGGKDKFKELQSYLESKGYQLYPSVDIMEFLKSGNGYSFTLNACKMITKSYATQQAYELAFGTPSMLRDAWTILSPYYWSDLYNKLSSSFKAESVSGISLNQMSTALYSDFSRYSADGSMYYLRSDAVDEIRKGYEKLKNDGMSVLMQGANSYALAYADQLLNVPMYSSNYDLFDYDVPFYAMVVHGLMPYTTKSINSSADAEKLRLMALVTGTPIQYEMMYEDPNEFADSEYDKYFYTFYEGWIDRAAAEYKLFNDVVKGVSDSYITDYNRISDTEIESTFDNGTKIYVDLENNIVKLNGKEIKLADYGLGE